LYCRVRYACTASSSSSCYPLSHSINACTAVLYCVSRGQRLLREVGCCVLLAVVQLVAQVDAFCPAGALKAIFVGVLLMLRIPCHATPAKCMLCSDTAHWQLV
jgi:hypothetical protein